MNALQKLAIERAMELGQEALSTHELMVKWRETPLTEKDRTSLSMKLQEHLSSQRSWLRGVLAVDDEER
jgi:hypothetical protein